ncbi:MAG: RND family transporter [Gammaproteobacteria bacterium]|jgi:predicted RND superfamily exporter protein|nr:RND family transporter [Gammaproteobacteria bacterium]MBK6584611.1 RND family transporter [Gammaproteobacteria bacterium]MBK7170912.1 RND family transporter [Gammaproteobacteria bacterium]MBK8306392.1 RND family transporter [Gammaproteobacteria bacterium]MBK9666760.1 RND family transporter [Gammaproteobacteria bacterium]
METDPSRNQDLMARREERFIERMVFGHRPALVLVFALLSLFFAVQTAKLRPDASFEKMIPVEHPFIKAMLGHLAELGASGTTIQIAVENSEGDIFDAGYLAVLRQITDEVFYIEGVDRNQLKSLWTPNVRWTEVTESGFEGGVVMPDTYDGSAASLEALRQNLLRSGQVGRLVADNFRSSIVEAPIFDRDPISGRALDYQAFSSELEHKIRDRFEQGNIRVRITGFAKIVGDLLEGVTAIFLFAVITVTVTAVLLFCYTRCLAATIAPLGCSMIAVIWQLGLLSTLGYGLNAYSILIPFLVFAIGVSHGVQVVNAVGVETSAGRSRLMAAKFAFRGLYIAGMAALLSDAVGFLTMMLIDIEVIQDLGVAASVGVAVILLTNLVLLPVLMSYLGICLRGRQHIEKRQQADPVLWRLLARCATPRVATLALLVAALGYTVGLVGGRDLRIGDLDPGAPELRPDSRYNIDSRFINDNYATSSDVLVVMVETRPDSCYLYPNLERIDRFTWSMENVPGVESAISLATVARQVMMGFNEGSLKWAELSRNQRALDTTFGMVPPQLVNADCSLAPVALFLEDHKAETLATVVREVKAFAKDNDSDDIRFVLAAGNAGVEAATNEEIAKAQTQILILVYTVVAALVFLSFRSFTAVICIMVPLGLTSVLCNALMAWLGIGVKVATLPVIALGVGVGVDYAIYIYNRLQGFLQRGMNLEQAYFSTLCTTGAAVSLTGVALAIGVATWIWSPIKFQADMGVLLTFMFLLNMLGALWLLPALACHLIKPEKTQVPA